MTLRHRIAVEAQLDAFPALPATVAKVMNVIADPASRVSDLMQAILPDQSMCTAILKVANSAFFGIPQQVGTIERAVVVLGYESIRSIVIGKAIFAAFPKMTNETRTSVRLFWEHAFTCGLAAKIIGEHLDLSPSELFISGLVHDIGKVAIFITFPHEYPVMGDAQPGNYGNAAVEEERLFTVRHDQLGLQLAEKWQLPQRLAAAIGYHHRPGDAPFFRQYPAIVQVADILALMYGNADILRTEDIGRIFDNLLPGTSAVWAASHLPWDSGHLRSWFDQLSQSREKDAGILNIFANP